MTPLLRQIVQRMSLRKPQTKSLEAFERATNLISLKKNASLEESLQLLQTVFPHISDFERDFPNLCFALATGVGKTRLMGAMISYLFLSRGISDFVVLAPNNTILDKLTKEFSDPNHPKYIFRGISNFNQPPKIITHLNYDEGCGVRNEWSMAPNLPFGNEVHINLFNIAMIHADKRRMKNPRETIVGGISYFEYLSRLDNLVVFMDEAHRYRASAATKAIDELNPILGVELTATPHIEKSGQSIPFNNIVYHYDLPSALNDSFVKEPAVVGRENYEASPLDGEALERLKMEDGIRCHEATKIHLHNYAYEKDQVAIKPIMLIIAKDMAHANRLESIIKNNDFFHGAYKQKVRVVHSGLSSDKEEEMIMDLLAIESPQNPIEIVIHVNMLKEGWDVVNLFTIVPLRAANSKTLIEQSLGRGLRLPFGQRTNIKEIDELKLISHDQFDEIINEAKKLGINIRSRYLGQDIPLEGFKNLEARPPMLEAIAKYSEREKIIAEKTLQIIEQKGDSLTESIIREVKTNLGGAVPPEIDTIITETIKKQRELSIRIPRILIEPEVAKPGRYKPFNLNVQGIHPQPIDQSILVQSLQDDSRRKIAAEAIFDSNEPPENMLIRDLLDLDDMEYNTENIQIISDLACQLIAHLHSYLDSRRDMMNVLMTQRVGLVNHIHAQLKDHFEPPEYRFASTVERNFTFFKSAYYALPADQNPISFDQEPDSLAHIARHVFFGYKKSQYPLNKFHSNSERVFAVVLEQDPKVIKWVRPPRNSLNLFYHRERQYEPDFIVETDKHMFLCEIKSSAELEDEIVQKKTKAAIHWCELATNHAIQNEGKPWSYLLIPHTAVRLTSSILGLANQFTMTTI